MPILPIPKERLAQIYGEDNIDNIELQYEYPVLHKLENPITNAINENYIPTNKNCPVHIKKLPFMNFGYINKYSGEVFMRLSDTFSNISPEYFISNYGRIYDVINQMFLNLPIYIEDGNTNKYARFSYNGKTYAVHRLELSCFVENNYYNYNLQPDHINGIKNDNRLNLFNKEKNNLEWVTRRENIIRAYNLGLSKTGERNVHSNISDADAMKVIELLATREYTSKQIVDKLQIPNLTIHIIDDIRKKEAWARLSEGIEFHQRINRQFTEEDIHNFCKVFQELYLSGFNMSINDRCREALRRNGFDPSMRYIETLRKVYVRKYYPNITSQYKF